MWQIILQILAIIGIVVLVVAGILILLICLVLFTPIRYRIEGEIDTTTKTYLGSVKATWLLHIISVTGGYPTPGTITIKIFGYSFKVIPLGETEDTESDLRSDKEGSNLDEVTFDSASECQPENSKAEKDKTELEEPVDDTTAQKTSEKWYHKIIYTIRNLCDKIKAIWNTIQYYKDVLDEKQTRLFIDRSKKRIFKFLKAIAPKRLQGNLRVGTGSPDTTGYLIAVYGMLVPYLDKRFSLEPDFEEAVCVGEVTAKGRIYLWTALIVVLGFATDKHSSILLKKLKREEQ